MRCRAATNPRKGGRSSTTSAGGSASTTKAGLGAGITALALVGAGGEACAVFDATGVGVSTSTKAGTGGPQVGVDAGVGVTLSNTYYMEQLAGTDAYVEGGGGIVGVGRGSISDTGPFHSISGGVGLGAEAGSAAGSLKPR